MTAFEQGLPNVMMGINKARAQDLVCAIDNFSAKRGLDSIFNPGDDVSLDEEVCFDGQYMIVCTMRKHSTTVQESRLC